MIAENTALVEEKRAHTSCAPMRMVRPPRLSYTRCEMESTVRPSDARRSASSTRAAVSASRSAVDLVEQQYGRVRRRGACNGEELPLALGKEPV